MIRLDQRATAIRREQCHDELRAYVDGVRYFVDDAMASKIARAAVFGGSVDPVARLQFEAWDALRRMHVVALAESYARGRRRAYPLPEISMGRPPVHAGEAIGAQPLRRADGRPR